jgi:nucleobase:cation symporter-1, NCS1 family
MISYIVFWCIQTPLQMVSPARLRYLFLAKSIIGPIAGFACMGFYAKRSGGYLCRSTLRLDVAPDIC